MSISHRSELLHTFADLAAAFNSAQQQVTGSERAFFDAWDALVQCAQQDPLAASALASDSPLRQAVSQQCLDLNHLIQGCQKRIATKERNTEFRQRFGDSLLIYVYGKVKAGKSSFGNFMAYGKNEPTTEDIRTAEPKPEFFLETSTGITDDTTQESMRQQQHFRVGFQETTSAIQGFSLPGVTFIDSPGLHSKMAENGDLAKAYVDAADLVLFLSNSQSPVRRSELEELKALGLKSHNMAIALTKSDRVEYDEDANGEITRSLVMLSDDERETQMNYAKQEIDTLAQQLPENEANALRACRIFSISTRYAEKNQDPSHWQDSGMADFSRAIAEIAQGQGVQMKINRPLQNLYHFLKEVRTQEIAGLMRIISDVKTKIQTARQELHQHTQDQIMALKTHLSGQIDPLSEQYAMDHHAFKQHLEKLFAELCQTSQEAIIRRYLEDIDQVLIPDFDPESITLPEFKTYTESIRRHSTLKRKRGAAIGSFIGAVGTLVASASVPVAIGIGLAASYAGSKVGEQFDDDDYIQVDLGDNRDQIAQAAREQLTEHAEQQLNTLYKRIDERCNQPLENWLSALEQAIRHLDALTAEQLQRIQQQINHQGK